MSQKIEQAILGSEPDVVITHHPADTNNDHLQTSMACQEAVRLFQRRPEVKRVKEFWYMEVPSCTEWKINNALAHKGFSFTLMVPGKAEMLQVL